MSVNNDIRRIKKALEVFEIEGSNMVMIDLIYESLYGDGSLSPGGVINKVKLDYNKKLRELEQIHVTKYKQTKIQFNDKSNNC